MPYFYINTVKRWKLNYKIAVYFEESEITFIAENEIKWSIKKNADFQVYSFKSISWTIIESLVLKNKVGPYNPETIVTYPPRNRHQLNDPLV